MTTDEQTVSRPDIAGQFCGQPQPHAAHTWTAPVPFGATSIPMPRQCAGIQREVGSALWPEQDFSEFYLEDDDA